MKTIFLPIFHGHISRNTLLTRIFELLKIGDDLRVVVLCHEFKQKYYQENFLGGNFIFEGVSLPEPSILNRFFRSFYYYFVDSATVRLLQGEKYLLAKRYLKYFSQRFFTKSVGNLRFLRQLIRFLDAKLVKPQGFGALFEKYKPDLVLASSVTSEEDSMVLREAKARGVTTIGMIRSWDNLSVNKGNIRIFPDKLLVHNKFLLKDAVELADFPEERISVVGMPHFDYYVNDKRLTREELSKKLGLDPRKKIILFLMIGLSGEGLDRYVTSLVENLIEKDKVFSNFVLVVRPHPNSDKSVQVGKGTVINYPDVIEFKSDRIIDREFTKADLDIYAGLIAHSSAIISYQGTSIVDAAALGKPIICIAFDEEKNLPYLRGIRHQYEYSHLKSVLETGGVKIVYNEGELREAILESDLHPEWGAEARKKIVEVQCFRLDGKASLRVVEEIKKSLN